MLNKNLDGFCSLRKHIPLLVVSCMVSSSSSCRAASTDLPVPLSPPVSIIHRSREVFQDISCIGTVLLYIGFSWSSCLCLFMWRSPQELNFRFDVIFGISKFHEASFILNLIRNLSFYRRVNFTLLIILLFTRWRLEKKMIIARSQQIKTIIFLFIRDWESVLI